MSLVSTIDLRQHQRDFLNGGGCGLGTTCVSFASPVATIAAALTPHGYCAVYRTPKCELDRHRLSKKTPA
ncbi:hypothetical protein IQ07DRAFT_301447 [Pyrenochaeta sp. DS3sAY3a]|nr:hypothetical protein IQ07DRAFT_301447 [Pyrenochaeta sp. DS3sAY3a]